MTETGKRIADDWQPTEADIAFAQTRGFGQLAIDEIAAQFKDYWISAAGQNAHKRNWEATWRNWIRKERPAAKPINGSKAHTAEQLAIIAAHVRASFYERGRISREVMEQCVAAGKLTREEMEAKL